jgi:hypothetical protein
MPLIEQASFVPESSSGCHSRRGRRDAHSTIIKAIGFQLTPTARPVGRHVRVTKKPHTRLSTRLEEPMALLSCSGSCDTEMSNAVVLTIRPEPSHAALSPTVIKAIVG